MVRIRFTKKAGGGTQYYRVEPKALEEFSVAVAMPDQTANLKTWNGTIHHFPPGTVLDFSDRPYDATAPRRRNA